MVNVNLTSYLSGPQAHLDIMVFLFLESGNVTFGNESFSVYKGSLKFNIKVCSVYCVPNKELNVCLFIEFIQTSFKKTDTNSM